MEDTNVQLCKIYIVKCSLLYSVEFYYLDIVSEVMTRQGDKGSMVKHSLLAMGTLESKKL